MAANTSLGNADLPGAAPLRFVGAMLRCPRCRLLIRARVAALAPERCPRCLARQHVVVALELQTPGEAPPPV